MQQAIDQLSVNVQRVRNLGALYSALKSQTTGALDLSDILRLELVLVVSALDQFVHELTRLGMMEVWRGKRQSTDAFHRFNISLNSARLATSSTDDWLDYEIRLRHERLSFQQADRIADAIRLFSDVPLWPSVGSRLGLDASDVKRTLNLIVDRRNKIAHEADMNPAGFIDRWPIDLPMVNTAVDFVQKIANAIYSFV